MLLKQNQKFSKQQRYDYMMPFKNREQLGRHKRRPERDTDQIDESFQSVSPPVNKNDILTVYEHEDYVKLQTILTKKMQMISEGIQISQEKNKLKDKQIQMIAQTIQRAIEKISALEAKIAQKQKKISKISLKCHEKTGKISQDQEKIKKQSIMLNQEMRNCETLESDIKYLQDKLTSAQRQLENCRKIYNGLDEVEYENQQLRQQFSQLQNEEKMIEYRQNNEKIQCEELQHKLQELKEIYKERNKINKRNLAKLNTLKKQISNIDDSNKIIYKKVDQIKNLELELGQLNQQLLLFNQDIAELDFKIRKKQKNISDLKEKILTQKFQSNNAYSRRKQPQKIAESQQEVSRTENNSSKHSKNNSMSKNNQQLSVNSKNISPIRNRSNLTPTFPSNELQVNIESNLNNLKEGQQVSGDAFKNIQKLINRFEQIKNKEKPKS